MPCNLPCLAGARSFLNGIPRINSIEQPHTGFSSSARHSVALHSSSSREVLRPQFC